MALSYGQLERIVAEASGIRQSKIGTFQSRMKQWQKMKFPKPGGFGRGVRATYTGEDLFKLLVMIRLLRTGLTPERAISIVQAAWPQFRDGIARALVQLANGDEAGLYVTVSVNALAELMEPDAVPPAGEVGVLTDDHFAAVGGAGGEPDAAALERWGVSREHYVEAARLSFEASVTLDLSLLTMAALAAVSKVQAPGLVSGLAAEVGAWVDHPTQNGAAAARQAWAAYLEEAQPRLMRRSSLRAQSAPIAQRLLDEE